jgi:hypothetical protein
MGLHYVTFLVIYGLAQFAFGVMTQAERRWRSSLEGQVIASEGWGRTMKGLAMMGGLAWLALIIIGFMSLRWYLVIGLFFVIGGVGGVLYTSATVFRGHLCGPVHNFSAGIAGVVVAGLTLFLWVQRLLH